MIMVRSASDVAEPRTRVVPEPGLVTWATRYVRCDVGSLHATASLIEQEANTVGGAHFHAADQFQVVLGGAGLYGKTAVRPHSVHFARAFSPYGPIRAGEHGLRWFTLRNGRDPGGIKWMPAQREQLRAAGRRPEVIYGDPEIPLRGDGLGVWRFTLAPGEQRTGSSPAEGLGQFWIVLGGAGTIANADFDEPESLLFVGPDEPAVTLAAGSTGFDVLAVQFPSAA